VTEAARFNVRFVDKAAILDVTGPVRLGESEQALREKVQELVGSGNRNIAVNLAGVTMLDSSGIGQLVRSLYTARKNGAELRAGLEALADQKPDIVLIHDAARPFVTAALISRAIDAAARTGDKRNPAAERSVHDPRLSHRDDRFPWRHSGRAGSHNETVRCAGERRIPPRPKEGRQTGASGKAGYGQNLRFGQSL